MKRFLAFLVRLLAVAFVGVLPMVSHAADYDAAQYDTTPGAGDAALWTMFEAITGNMTLFFGVVVVLAILVTGFFLGRKWLRRVG